MAKFLEELEIIVSLYLFSIHSSACMNWLSPRHVTEAALANRTNELQNVPSTAIVSIVLSLALFSAYFVCTSLNNPIYSSKSKIYTISSKVSSGPDIQIPTKCMNPSVRIRTHYSFTYGFISFTSKK